MTRSLLSSVFATGFISAFIVTAGSGCPSECDERMFQVADEAVGVTENEAGFTRSEINEALNTDYEVLLEREGLDDVQAQVRFDVLRATWFDYPQDCKDMGEGGPKLITNLEIEIEIEGEVLSKSDEFEFRCAHDCSYTSFVGRDPDANPSLPALTYLLDLRFDEDGTLHPTIEVYTVPT